jgi:uracil-DNA glycosylase family 4
MSILAPTRGFGAEPGRDCPLCPRLLAYRQANRKAEPGWWNGPALSFGDPAARLLIVGLAPGRGGANRTGRPFTGDYAGELLYGTLAALGLSTGTYRADPDDGLSLRGVAITNAVRCAPPENKPTPEETETCRRFLVDQLTTMTQVTALLALGKVAHDSVLKLIGARLSAFPFAHAASHRLSYAGRALTLVDSYHCSRYNTQTGRLTAEMFAQAMHAAAEAAGLTPTARISLEPK